MPNYKCNNQRVAPHTGHGGFLMTTCTCTCNARTTNNNSPATYTYILWVNEKCTIVPYDTEEEAARDGQAYLREGASTFRVEKWQD